MSRRRLHLKTGAFHAPHLQGRPRDRGDREPVLVFVNRARQALTKITCRAAVAVCSAHRFLGRRRDVTLSHHRADLTLVMTNSETAPRPAAVALILRRADTGYTRSPAPLASALV